MMRFLTNNIFLILSVLLHVLYLYSHALANENVMVFDGSGNVISSYEVGEFTISTQSNGNNIETVSRLFPNGPTGASQLVTLNVALPSGAVAFVPNRLNGSFPVSSGGLPDVSLYSLDAAMTNRSGAQPGLSFSPSQGTYNKTLTVTVQATDGAHLEYAQDGHWVIPASHKSALTIDVYKTTALVFRARKNSALNVFVDVNASFVIERDPQVNPEMVDSDGDGIPDSWEIAHGSNPLLADIAYDGDENGYADLDEILHELHLDTDGDGWSDFDEIIRDTLPGDEHDFPTARRLNEVEYRLDAEFRMADNSPVPVRFTIYELHGDPLVSFPVDPDEKMTSVSGLRFPAGSSAVIRALGGEDEKFILKHYLPMIKDVSISDLEDWCARDETPDYNWNSWNEWQALVILMLTDLLSPQPINVVSSPETTVPVYMLEQQLGIVAVNSDTVHFLLGEFGHAPSPAVVGDLQGLLAGRNSDLNTNFEHIKSLLFFDQECHDIVTAIVEIYVNYSANNDNLELSAAGIMAESSSRYLAALALYYDQESLNSLRQLYGLSWCQLFLADSDIDGDTLGNLDEILNQWDISSSDTDDDGIADNVDNCPAVTNPKQSDFDSDGLGDACDADDDNDGLEDLVEQAFGSNPYNSDTDNDGVNDADEWAANTHPGVAVYITDLQSPTNLSAQIIEGYRYQGADVTISIPGAVVGQVVYSGDTVWTCAISNLLLDGIYAVSLEASFDGNQGYGSATIIIDRTAPVVTISSPVDGSTVNIPNPVLIFDASGTVTVYLDNNQITIISGGNLPAMEDGSHTVLVAASDDVGNVGFAETTFIVNKGQSTFPWLMFMPAILGDGN